MSVSSENAYNPKKHFRNERTLVWGQSLTKEQMNSLRQGEIFILLDEDGEQHAEVLMDSYDNIRERRLRSE